MKKFILLLSFLFILPASASATVYKWVDERGVMNFADDYSRVPSNYRDRVEEVRAPRMEPPASFKTPLGKTASLPSGEKGALTPPIAQTLIREGDFAVKLTEALKVGQAESDIEAEDLLASVGIAPKNGWIADYPVTPDIIGELKNAIGSAADSGKLTMNRDQAMKAFYDLTAQQGLPVKVGGENEYAGAEQPSAEVAPPQDYPQPSEPSVINDYYDEHGPPIVTYYPPPRGYDYLYAWVPYPFWYGGFRFPGFFCLKDFHRGCSAHGKEKFVSNHFWDSKGKRSGSIDPARRHMGNAQANRYHPVRGFKSNETSKGASSISRRSSENMASNRPGDAVSGSREKSGPSSAGGPSTGHRPPFTGYSQGGVSFSHPKYGSSSKGPGMGNGRSFGLPSRSGSSGFHGGGSGTRGSSGRSDRSFSGGSRGFSGGIGMGVR